MISNNGSDTKIYLMVLEQSYVQFRKKLKGITIDLVFFFYYI